MKHFYLFFLLIIQIGFSQTTTRINLQGLVKCDSTKVENVIVFNVNLRSGTVVNKNGFFEINAKVRDTLVFSSLSFQTKKLVLTADDFEKSPLVVNLKLFITQLYDVNVSRNNKNPISGNTQKYVDRQYVDDEKSHLKNPNVYDGQTPGINFVRLLTDVIKIFKKKKPKQNDYFADVSFTDLVLKKVKYTYFTNTLKLKDEEIRLFLYFCENDENAKDLSRYKTVFELMDFLYNKNKEFTAVKNEIK